MVSTALVTLGLAAAIHADWHFARPAHHRLSLELWWHWMLAIPVFALTAAYVARVWARDVAPASVAILGIAVVVAGILEPLWEYSVGGASLEWAFGTRRAFALFSFVGTGLVTYVVTLAWLRRGSDRPAAGGR